MAKGSKGKKRPPGKRPAGGGGAGATPRTAPATGAGRTSEPSGPATGAPAPPKAPSQAPPGGRAKPTRTERLEAARRARQRKALLVRVGIVGAVVLVAGVIAFVMIDNRRDANANIDRLTAGSCAFDREADDTAAATATSTRHNPPAGYTVNPPSAGNHDPTPAPGGFYGAGQTTPADANLVHSLEHGFVVIWHRPDITDEETTQLREVFEAHDDDVIVVPRPSLEKKVAATAWERRLLCDEVEPEALTEFVELYRNDSPESGVR